MDTSGHQRMLSSSSKPVALVFFLASSDDSLKKKDSRSSRGLCLCGMREKRACGDGQMANHGVPVEYLAAS